VCARALLSLAQVHSERVPNKNFRLLCGQPLYAWTLSALLGSAQVARVVIDTDSTTLTDELADLFSGDAHRIQARACACAACVAPAPALLALRQRLRTPHGCAGVRVLCKRCALLRFSRFERALARSRLRRCWSALRRCAATLCP
jgi:hypothetical protein